MRAILIKRIKFIDHSGNECIIPVNSEIVFDHIESIGYYNGQHFYLSRNEYQVLN